MATMKLITSVVEINHGGEVTTLRGVDADQALAQLTSYDGVGNIYIKYIDPDTNELTGFMFCCDDSWRRKPNEIEEVQTRDCGFDCADEIAFADPVLQINPATGQPLTSTSESGSQSNSNSESESESTSESTSESESASENANNSENGGV